MFDIWCLYIHLLEIAIIIVISSIKLVKKCSPAKIGGYYSQQRLGEKKLLVIN